MKAVLVICDGLGDRPIKKLQGKTPLEAVNTPALDKLSKLGANGLIDVISPGIPPGSDTAHMALFGYDPNITYTGRGALEAIGSGLKVEAGDVAFRSNFATVNSDMIVMDRRAGRISSEEGRELAKSLQKIKLPDHTDVEVILRHSTEHRGALILRGSNLSPKVSDSDPEEENLKVCDVHPTDQSESANNTARILNALTKVSFDILNQHPLNAKRLATRKKSANVLLFRGAGSLPRIRSLTDTYGIRARSIVTNALVRGVAILAGMNPIDVPGATGTASSDLIAKAREAEKSLLTSDLVFIHVKGADNASHDKNLSQKLSVIRKIDRMITHLLSKLNLQETSIAVTADHATPVSYGNHVGDPVPLAIAGQGIVPDSVKKFSERHCSQGGLGRIRGIDLMPLLMNLINRTTKFGA